MTTKAPQVPPANRSPHDPRERAGGRSVKDMPGKANARPSNTNEQGQQGNIHQNTTNQGHQQDR